MRGIKAAFQYICRDHCFFRWFPCI